MAEKRIRPFANGSQYLDWDEHNCSECVKGIMGATGPPCDLLITLAAACADDGTVNAEVARRIGHTEAHARGTFPYTWPCPEKEVLE